MPRRPGPVPYRAEVIDLHGNASKLSREEIERRRASEVKARPMSARAPADLSPHARECWQTHAPELVKLGLLSVLDSGAFRLACESYALALYALESMRPTRADGEPDGRTTRLSPIDVDRVHGGQPRKHPGFSVFNMAQNAYRGWCVEFGLTPSSRVGLRPGAMLPAGSDGAEGADSDDDDFFGTGSG